MRLKRYSRQVYAAERLSGAEPCKWRRGERKGEERVGDVLTASDLEMVGNGGATEGAEEELGPVFIL